MSDRLIGTREICEKLGISKATLYSWMHKYKIFLEPVAQVSGRSIWFLSDVVYWFKTYPWEKEVATHRETKRRQRAHGAERKADLALGRAIRSRQKTF
jgi:predicted DNA-binding transcriptional regulator AlpA